MNAAYWVWVNNTLDEYDRHGGQPSALVDVSREVAVVAVSLTMPLVNWFEGLVARKAGANV